MNETTSALSNSASPSHDQISQKARALWERYGQPSGRDEEIWLEAERLLSSPNTRPSENNSSAGNGDQRPVDTPLKNTSAITATTGIASAGRGSAASPRGKSTKK